MRARAFGKYWRNGMGLHSDQFLRIVKHLNQFDVVRGVEFGSGGSTEFFERFVLKKWPSSFLTSFDHDPKFAYESANPDISIRIRPLEAFSDEEWQSSFENRVVPENGRPLLADELRGFRQRNAFYSIEPGDVPAGVNYVLVDGPNGNGRSAAFLHLQGQLDAEGAICMVDDVHHYDFEERLFQVFPASEIIAKVIDRDVGHNFGWGMYWIRDSN